MKTWLSLRLFTGNRLVIIVLMCNSVLHSAIVMRKKNCWLLVVKGRNPSLNAGSEEGGIRCMHPSSNTVYVWNYTWMWLFVCCQFVLLSSGCWNECNWCVCSCRRTQPTHHRPLGNAWNYDSASGRYPATNPTPDPYPDERRETQPVVHKKRPKSR
jgi:hypothetical protein